MAKQLKSYGGEDHDSVTPHLLHSINVTQIDMEFVDLSWNSSFTSTRIAAEFALVASESPKKAYKITKRKTIDDEHTPGIFTLVDVISPDGSNGTQGKLSLAHFQVKKNSTFSLISFFWYLTIILQVAIYNFVQLAIRNRIVISHQRQMLI